MTDKPEITVRMVAEGEEIPNLVQSETQWREAGEPLAPPAHFGTLLEWAKVEARLKTLSEVMEDYARAVLRHCDGDQDKAAGVLGISVGLLRCTLARARE